MITFYNNFLVIRVMPATIIVDEKTIFLSQYLTRYYDYYDYYFIIIIYYGQ